MPRIFKTNISNRNTNNKNISIVKKNSDIGPNSNNVLEELDKLFSTTRYVFNIGVIIKTKDRIYDTKIISKNKGNVLTVDEDVIPIKDIYELIIKDRY